MHEELIARLEAATGAEQKFLLREAFDLLLPEPRKWNGFPWINPRAEWVEWYQNWRWFEAAMRIGAYESAALLLVNARGGWYEFSQTLGGGLARITLGSGHTVFGNGKTPALAICIAALRAKGGGA